MPHMPIPPETEYGYVGYKKLVQARIASNRKTLLRDEQVLKLMESSELVQEFLQLVNTPVEE